MSERRNGARASTFSLSLSIPLHLPPLFPTRLTTPVHTLPQPEHIKREQTLPFGNNNTFLNPLTHPPPSSNTPALTFSHNCLHPLTHEQGNQVSPPSPFLSFLRFFTTRVPFWNNTTASTRSHTCLHHATHNQGKQVSPSPLAPRPSCRQTPHLSTH